jgi:rSAM/selenodomain-associated transferase 1
MPVAAGSATGSAGVVVVFAKAPHPGLVKTRLCPPLDPVQAADLYAHLLDDVLETTDRFARDAGYEAVLTVHPAEARPELAARAPRGFRVIAQHGASLADRMTWAVAEAAAGGADRILLRGSDNPALSLAHLRAAARGLDEHDLVVSPDLDGGYGLIGVRAPWPGLFDHPMSTHTVLDETLANAARLGLRVERLEASFDVDRVEDLSRLARAHRGGRLDACERTVEWIRRSGLWPTD